MPLSLTVVLIIAVVASTAFLAVGAFVGIVWLRSRHRQLMPRSNGLARGLSAYHRTHLSVDGSNYSHVALPRTSLRKSAHLPYGVVSVGYGDLPSQESLAHRQMNVIHEQPDPEPTLVQPRRRRSLRNSFSGHSFYVPKTRRQKRIDKAIPLTAVGRSPLSAITEFSDPNTCDTSPAIGVAELPTEITPRPTPPMEKALLKPARSASSDWPLPISKRRSQDVMPTRTDFSVDRNSALMRMNSTGHNSASHNRPSLGQRSTSMASTISAAPGDPLPPLPVIVGNRYLQRNNSRVRSSIASTDTVGSSVLGTGVFSPSQAGTDFTSNSMESPPLEFDLSETGEHDTSRDSWGPSAVTMGTPPGTKLSHSYRDRRAAVGSFRASIDTNFVQQTASTKHASNSIKYANVASRAGETTLTTLDASNWNVGPSFRGSSIRKSLTPSLPAPVIRSSLTHRNGKPVARHSMYEQHLGADKVARDADVFQEASGRPLDTVRQPRPASVGTSNPFQWDQNASLVRPDVGFRASMGSQRRGHRRQNCIRIANLPPVDMNRGSRKLPQMTEEDEQPATPTPKSIKAPGLGLAGADNNVLTLNSTSQDTQPSPSPFRNLPVLNPTSGLNRERYSRASSTESFDSPQPDSDIFSNACYGPKTPTNIFTRAKSDQNWPLSPTPLNSIKLNSTSSANLHAISEPYDPESPILPSPTLVSANLFASRARKSVVQGPRTLPRNFSINSCSARSSPSPLMSRGKHNMAKQRSGDELRRSVMMLRCMNSDTLSDDRISKIYRNIAEEYQASESILKSPDATTNVGVALGSPSRTNADVNTKSVGSEKRPSLVGQETVQRSQSRTSMMGHSPSMKSTTGASIWEDASVRGDSPEPEMPLFTLAEDDDVLVQTPGPKVITVDVEAYENFLNHGSRPEKTTSRGRDSRLTSPQDKGLGLTGVGVEGTFWGTPASLYDRDGFLRE